MKMIKCTMENSCSKGKDCCCCKCDEFETCDSKCNTTENVTNCGFAEMDGETSLQLFQEQHMQVFKQLAEVTKTKKQMEDQEKKFKEELEKAMDQYDIKSIDNQFLKITRVNGSTTTSVDLKKLGEKEPKLYEELIGDYPKVTNKKSYLTFKVK